MRGLKRLVTGGYYGDLHWERLDWKRGLRGYERLRQVETRPLLPLRPQQSSRQVCQENNSSWYNWDMGDGFIYGNDKTPRTWEQFPWSQSWWWMWLTWFANGSQGQSKGQRPSPAQNFILRPNYFVKITAYISLDNRLEYKRAETEGRYKILKFWNVIFCWYWIERLQSYHYIFWPVLRRVGQRRRLQQPSSLCPIPLWNNCFLLKENKFS